MSSWVGSRFRTVIFTARRAVFILTSTERIVPWTIVPGGGLVTVVQMDRW